MGGCIKRCTLANFPDNNKKFTWSKRNENSSRSLEIKNIKESRANTRHCVIVTKKKWRRSCTRFEKFASDIGYREEKWLDVTRKREESRQLSRVIDRREIRPRDFIRSLSRFSFQTFLPHFLLLLLLLVIATRTLLSKKGYRANCILLLSNNDDSSRKGRGKKG